MAKYKILWATDSPVVQTGFGRVSSELITRLLKTGKFEIHVMGTNDRGDPHPLRGMKDLFIYPLADFMGDPYGFHYLEQMLHRVNPDLVFALNDIWVWTGDEKREQMNLWFPNKIRSYKPNIPWVAYFAIDGRPWDQRWVQLANTMNKIVCMADYGKKVLQETPGVDMEKVVVIPHGACVDKFFPLPIEERRAFRQRIGVNSDDVFVVGCVARNQPRKNIPRLVQAFKCFSDGYGICNTCKHYRSTQLEKDCEICGDTEFEKTFPGVGKENTFLYLHMNIVDGRGFRLPKIFNDNKIQNIIFPQNFDIANGVPIEELNKIYNAMDVHVLPSYAGGFELPVIESQAAGVPNIVTRSTAMTEHVDNGKGFPVLADSWLVMDDANHCYKHLMSFNGLVDQLNALYNDKALRLSVVDKARAYALERNWDAAAEQFYKVFMDCLEDRIIVKDELMKEKAEKKVLMINNSPDPAAMLALTPTLRIMKEREKADIFMVCDNKVATIIENNVNIEKIFDNRKVIFDDIQTVPQLAIRDVSDIIPQFARANARFANMTNEELILDSFKYPKDDSSIDFNITQEARKYALDLLPKTDKLRVAICIDASHPTTSLPIQKWQDLIKLCSRSKKFETIIFNAGEFQTELVNENVNIMPLFTDYNKLCATVDRCDVLVTLDNSFTMFGKILGKYMIIPQGPRDFSYKMGDYKNFEIINKKSMLECVPCWIIPGEHCAVSNSETAVCMTQITPVEIFGKIIKKVNQKDKQTEVECKGEVVVA